MTGKRYVAGILLAAFSLSGGTLIYRDRNSNQLAILPKVTIQTIADGQMQCEYDKKDFIVPLADVVRYYDEDLKVEGGYLDDNSTAYDIRLGDVEIPDNKKKQLNFNVRYHIMRRQDQCNDPRIRMPYFYLVVLTESEAQDGSIRRQRNIYANSNSARISSRGWSEIKVLEKLLAGDRPLWTSADEAQNKPMASSLSGLETTFNLTGLSKRKILAWYLTAWGKNTLEDSKIWIDPTAGIENDWLTRTYR